MTRPSDYKARQAALDPRRSFAVTAPAGSGKTGLLTQRVLTLLATAKDPEEILAITFTRKAAAEMQERIITALQIAATEPRPTEEHEQLSWDLAHAVLLHDQQHDWQLLKSPGRLRIQTIDGLCRSITQFQPLSSGLGGTTKMLDDPSAAYEQAVFNTLSQLEKNDGLQSELSLLLKHLDNNLESAIALLSSLLARRDQWMSALLQSRDAKTYLESVLWDLNTEVLSELRAKLALFASDLCLLADYSGNHCLTDNPDSALCQLAGITELPDSNYESIELWKTLVDFLLTGGGGWRSQRGLNVKHGFPPGKDKEDKALCTQQKASMGNLLASLSQEPKLLSLLQMVRYLPPVNYEQQQWALLDALTRILPHLVVELNWVFRQLNATDFIEVTQGALRALGDEESPTDTGLMLDYQVRHILVDEFQDTATPQLQLLEKLTAGWETDDGRTLFIVGDGMQSCYGFRDANVGIFLDARLSGIGEVYLEPLELTVNFRSQANIVHWVNTTFKEAFPDSDDIARGAVRYSESEPYRKSLQVNAVECHAFVDALNRQAEADVICEIVQQCQQQDAAQSIAILVRNRSHLQEIIPALQASHIDWQATDIEPLAGRMAVVDLITLTRALMDPCNRNYWLALLRTPWIGLDNKDMLTVAGLTALNEKAFYPTLLPHLLELLSDNTECQRLSTEGLTNLQRAVPLIHFSWLNRRRKSVRQQVQGLWLALGGPACVESSIDLKNAEDYFQLLEKFDSGGSLSNWLEFELAIKKLYARADTHSENPVQVMTIHKSKGLEFDQVIIPGLDKPPRADSPELLLWQERIDQQHNKQLLLSPLTAKGEETDQLYNFLREENKLKQKLETTRLLYVGCTRAIKQLHLLTQVKSTTKGDAYKAPSPGSLLAPLWDSVQQDLTVHIPEQQATEEANNESITEAHYLSRLKTSWQRPRLTASSLLQDYRGQEFEEDENVPDSSALSNRYERHLGTILHRALARITEEGVHTWSATRVERQQPFWVTQLMSLGLDKQKAESAAVVISQAVTKTLDDTTGQWLLSNNHTQSACELEIWGRQNNARLYVIDRTFIDDETRWIVDYKSSRPSDNQPFEDFIRAEVESYSQQLKRYSQLFVDGGHKKITTALYFPLLAHLEIVNI